MEIHNWWKTHKNILKRHADDMPPINYEKESVEFNAWDWITTALTQEKSDEAKQYRSEIKYVFNGNQPGRMFGYQYLSGAHFPTMYSKRPQVKTGKKQ